MLQTASRLARPVMRASSSSRMLSCPQDLHSRFKFPNSVGCPGPESGQPSETRQVRASPLASPRPVREAGKCSVLAIGVPLFVHGTGCPAFHTPFHSNEKGTQPQAWQAHWNMMMQQPDQARMLILLSKSAFTAALVLHYWLSPLKAEDLIKGS